MSKRALDWNEEKYKRFLKEKRGQGEGTDYNPWLHIQDFPSKGRVSRVKGWKTQRVHHFFSDNETRCFYLFDWEDSIFDIREQHPLIDVERAMYIAEKFGIKIQVEVKKMINCRSKPERITINKIGQIVGALALIQKHLNKMPKTKEFLESVVDTVEDHQIKRVKWGVSQLKLMGKS